MRSPRALLKQTAERLAASVVGNPRRMSGRRLVLAYHNVVHDSDAGRGDRSLHLPFSVFRRQLDLLEEHCRVVSLAELLDAGPDGDRPTVAITFDDAYRGAVELGLPEVIRRGLQATLFVAPGLLGIRVTWWDGWSEHAEADAGKEIQRILEVHNGRSTSPAGVALPEHYACASEGQVLELSRNGIDLGAHTWSHPNLARLERDDLRSELERPLAWLRQRGVSPAMLAYPYGISNSGVERAAEEVGYRAAFRVLGGWMSTAPESRWSLPRFNVPARLSEAGFRLRLAGRLTT